MNLKPIASILLGMLVLNSCKKEDTGPPNPYGEDNGSYSFYAKTDLGVGNISVYIDNELAGTISHYHANGVECGKADVNIVKSQGGHTFRATSQSGTTWSEKTIVFESGKCISTELTGGNNGMPAQYNNQGIINVHKNNLQICAKDWDVIDGDVITIVVNGVTIASNVNMTGNNKCWNVTVNKGNNWIGIICNSPGTTAAASPRIEIYDGSSNQAFNILSYPNQPGGYIIRLD